ncbi:MAG: adenylyl-sulfate kinase [Nitrospiraceae bacterium]|nr:MAG: adenylyl-sulfate kinase [Nitrospiraceae bacterium]
MPASTVIWITGLPGSGKSTVALALKKRAPRSVIIRMDDLRKIVTPEPTYSADEREYVYRALVYTAKTVAEQDLDVIIDATGNRRSWRRLARDLIPRFVEVYLKCPLALCAEREKRRIDRHSAPGGIYEKGEAGWPVPGVNVPYEEPENPEVIIDTEKTSPVEAAECIHALIQKRH